MSTSHKLIGSSSRTDIAVHTLGYMYRIAGSIHSSPNRAVLTSDLYRTTSRMWHDTLKSLASIRTKGTAQTKLKIIALKHWRLYGESLYLKEGAGPVMTLNRASPLSEEKAYWRIPRHCFWLGCACSGHKPFHPVRVCKGCWRALYCSAQCQRR